MIPCVSNSQSLEDVNKQATSMGVTTQSDVLKELDKRGMTEADARRMAAVYGLDYDEYIAKYITNKISVSNNNSINAYFSCSFRVNYYR